jgi:hypothetical protein
MENKMTKGEKHDGRGSPQARLIGAQSQAAVASDRQSTPQSIDSEAAEGVGGDFPIVGIGMSAGGL